MGAHRHGQEGALSGNVVKCFVHCKMLSRRIIYALFSQPGVSASGVFTPEGPHLHRGSIPRPPLGYFRPQTLNLPTPGKNAGTHV